MIYAFSNMAMAHNMSDDLKKAKIMEAVSHITKNVTHYDISISSNIASLDLKLHSSRFDSGDQDIDKIIVTSQIGATYYQIDCDLISGEYGDDRPIYFLVYKNCTLINLDNFKIKSIKLSKQAWNDWRY